MQVRKRTIIAMAVASIMLIGFDVWAAGNKSVVMVSASVVGNLSQETLRQESLLTVTEEDLARGYIDVETGTIFKVSSNDKTGYFIQFNTDGLLLREALLTINGRAISVPAGLGLIHQPSPGLAGETLNINYRLFLNPGLKAGTYSWPIAVSALLM